MSSIDDAIKITREDRPFGIYQTPQALIAQVVMLFNHTPKSHRDIADQCEVTIGDVCGIVAGTWGEPEWYHPANSIGARGPYKAPDEVASTVVNIRCKGSDKASWEQQAKQAGLSMSRWMIATLNAGAHISSKYEDGAEDYLHYLQECTKVAKSDLRMARAASRNNSSISQKLVNIETELNRIAFAVGRLVEERGDAT